MMRLFEFGDLRIVPKFIKEGITLYLCTLYKIFPTPPFWINNIKKAALTLTSSNKVRIKQKAIDKSKFDIKETFEILEGEKIIKF